MFCRVIHLSDNMRVRTRIESIRIITDQGYFFCFIYRAYRFNRWIQPPEPIMTCLMLPWRTGPFAQSVTSHAGNARRIPHTSNIDYGRLAPHARHICVHRYQWDSYTCKSRTGHNVRHPGLLVPPRELYVYLPLV
jgi:hypothetical protein